MLRCSAFFIVHLSHPYMTTGKTIALSSQTFVDKVISLLFDMLSRLVIVFLPRTKRLLISWLQSPSAVTLSPPKIKSLTVSIVSPSIYQEVMDQISSLVGSKYIFLTQYVSKFGKNSAVAIGLQKVSFDSNPKERQCQRMLKLPHNCTHLTY